MMAGYCRNMYIPVYTRRIKAWYNNCLLLVISTAFFVGGRRGTRTPKHFVNLTGESKNFKMEFPLNQLQTCYGYLCDLLSFM
jgi:hypothetical protein